MQDYYTILEIERTASARDIKAAYKRLAMLYHPDRNAGDKEAEERFKLINEAYHVLSDPLKKSRYDGGEAVDYETILTQAYWREVKKKRFYQYKQAQQRQYKIDKEYYKIQGLAFLVFTVIAGFCFALIHTIDYFIAVQREKHWQHNTELIKQVNVQFSAGKFHEAFNMIKVFHDKDPTEFRFNFVRDSLVGELRRLADRSFDSKKFSEAVDFYGTLKVYEKPVRLETLERIASCQYYMGNFGESIQALKHLHNQQPHNLDLVYRIAIINLDNTHNYNEALYYFSLGKKLFKENLSEVYGDAFEIVMDPWDAPDVYYALFIGRAKTNLHLGDYEEALTDANWAVFLRRNQPEGFRLRADAKIAMRQRNGVCSDLQSAKTFGDIEADQLLQQHCR